MILGTLGAMAAMVSGPQGKAMKFEGAYIKPISIEYMLDLPKDYATSGRSYPLLLFLHGAGERGSDLWQVRVHGPAKMIDAGMDIPMIVVSPQCPADQWWDVEVLSRLVDAIQVTHRVDPSRLYVTGLSMGGYGTWELIGRFPGRFAAAAPICGGGNPALARHMADVPLWVVHGDKDEAVRLPESERMVEAVKRSGGTVRFDVIKDGGHDVWTDFYADPKVYKWFLSHRRTLR